MCPDTLQTTRLHNLLRSQSQSCIFPSPGLGTSTHTNSLAKDSGLLHHNPRPKETHNAGQHNSPSLHPRRRLPHRKIRFAWPFLRNYTRRFHQGLQQDRARPRLSPLPRDHYNRQRRHNQLRLRRTDLPPSPTDAAPHICAVPGEGSLLEPACAHTPGMEWEVWAVGGPAFGDFGCLS